MMRSVAAITEGKSVMLEFPEAAFTAGVPAAQAGESPYKLAPLPAPPVALPSESFVRLSDLPP